MGITRSKLEFELARMQELPQVSPVRLRSWLRKVVELQGPSLPLLELLQGSHVAYEKCLRGEGCNRELLFLGASLIRLHCTLGKRDDDRDVLAVEWARAELIELLSSSAN